MTMPSLFIAHGSPMLALEDSAYTAYLQRLGRRLPVPKAIAIFSAHWDDPQQLLTDADRYEAIHDFYGYPEELYQIRYSIPGDRKIAYEVQNLFQQSNLKFKTVPDRGLDHGAWVVLRRLYPDAEIPALELSIDSKRSPMEQYEIGKMLAALRDKGVLIIGSGALVHNLRLSGDNGPVPQVEAFDQWVSDKISQWNLSELFRFDKLAPNVRDAVPSYAAEHFCPLFYAMGAADNERTAKRLFQDRRPGALNLDVWQFGGTDLGEI
ncbi:DODA-type extradiol aromatic ring-opening family dioxygenase [Paenibacillus physcomitrellae]|uniref:Dioxygenase n=1 Tax=Paenibacillus physcomitrellae TaxID=1619311 RepID=A0ABQ1GYT4_9BACL|nr:class III extradiol ring-cleavage dioxygenase [Paenibacillus physcomitrellae]GGA52102.1 dioxygenase [Paenibacillus physcomitrellae]